MKNKGYTLVEVLTAITIFGLITGSVTSLFISSISIQRRILASQKLFDNTSYVLEYMSRALRMAKKDKTNSCLEIGSGYNYSTSLYGYTDRISSIRFLNHYYKCQEFYLKNDGRIYQRLSNSTSSAGLTGTELALTPSDFIISTTTSKFFVSGAVQPPIDYFQPRVTFFLDVETKALQYKARAKIKIQTTISQRDLDVEVE